MAFSAGDIDPFLCTHIIFAFSQLDGNNMTTEGYNDIDLKTINPSLKVISAVGGWSHGVERFSAMAATDQNIEEFADNAISFLRRYRLDGLDLDWEYPSSGVNSWRDKNRFTRLVQILHQRFQEEGTRTTRRPLLLSAAVSAGKWTIDDSYQVDLISKDLDFINLMSYDFHGSWESTTGHNCPLYARSDEQGFHRFLNQAEFIKEMKLAGSMVWAIDLDDFKNVCGEGVNPLMGVLKNALEYHIVDPITEPPVPSTTNTPQHLLRTQLQQHIQSPRTIQQGYTSSNESVISLNWAQYRPHPMNYTADDIDPFICTHIMYAFSQLNGNDMTIVEWNDLSTYQKVMNLKVTNPHLKVLLAVGGYNHGVERFSDMVSSDQAIEEFADNTIVFLRKSLDFIILMTYDFHGPWDSTTGHNSPLYPRQNENTFQKTLNQDAAVRYWLSKGTPPHKLVLGMALYGRSFTLASTSDVGLDADVVGAGTAASYTNEAGYIGYFEVCDRVQNQGWTRVWEAEHKVPFTYSGDQRIGYDDVESFTIKAEYIRSNRLGGSMVWAMDLDDFNNICGLGVNPMMSVLKTILSSPITASTTPTPSSGAPTTGTYSQRY
ncbi:acidic mammalian chitinase-like [Argopecten irradians]|uniref:acidic mammalian chitinase-like n=1 Tax=Argopecten irradians TaxID=31199 RepID=UPI00371E6B9E